jgi:gamma-glutamylcyclotransferase (GGCT)/AIG2-like uncharacterized protein YtfP
MDTVFVHGKFRQGCSDHPMVSNETCLGQAETVEHYALLMMENKPLVTKRPVCAIKGEAYTVSDETLKALDRREGHPHINKREIVKIKLADGSTVDAWVYFHVQPLRSSTVVESGDYAQVGH